jgi:1-acyl-sn-glycerol-3-phosphate acyltransferase
MSIAIGSRVPRRGNAFSRWIGGAALRLAGWRHEGSIPDEPKLVLIGAPHTSNVDGVLAILSLMALGLDARIMIKASAFRGLVGHALRWVGAVPVDRTSANGIVGDTVALMARHPQMLLLLAPEGTRGAAVEWKRGFHHIAVGAKVPIVVAACNYRSRVVSFSPSIEPTADYSADLAAILAYVHEHGYPRHPGRLSQPLCELAGRTWDSTPGGR